MGLQNFTDAELSLLKKLGYKIVRNGEVINTRYAVTGITHRILKDNSTYTFLTEGAMTECREYDSFTELCENESLDF